MDNLITTTIQILRDTADDIERRGNIKSTNRRLTIRCATATLEQEIMRLEALIPKANKTDSLAL